MTMQNLTQLGGPYIGDGADTTFAFTFHILAASHLRVEEKTISTGGLRLCAEGVDYTVPSSAVDNLSGGEINWIATVPTSDKQIVLTRRVPKTNTTALLNLGAYNPKTHESRYDEIAKGLLEHSERLDRSLHLSIFEQAFDCQLPTPAGDKLLATNSGNTAFQWVSTMAGVIGPGDLDTSGAALYDHLEFNGTAWAYQSGLNIAEGEAITLHTVGGNDAKLSCDAEYVKLEGHSGGHLGTAGANKVSWTAALFGPTVDGDMGLGTSAFRWSSLYAQSAQVNNANPALTLHDTVSADAVMIEYLGASNVLRLKTPGAGDSIAIRPGNGGADAALFDTNLDAFLYGALTLSGSSERINLTDGAPGYIYMQGSGYLGLSGNTGVVLRVADNPRVLLNSTVMRPQTTALVGLGNATYHWLDVHADAAYVYGAADVTGTLQVDGTGTFGTNTFAAALSAWNLSGSVQNLTANKARYISYGDSSASGAVAPAANVWIDANKAANERVLFMGIGGSGFAHDAYIERGLDNGTHVPLMGFTLDAGGADVVHIAADYLDFDTSAGYTSGGTALMASTDAPAAAVRVQLNGTIYALRLYALS